MKLILVGVKSVGSRHLGRMCSEARRWQGDGKQSRYQVSIGTGI